MPRSLEAWPQRSHPNSALRSAPLHPIYGRFPHLRAVYRSKLDILPPTYSDQVAKPSSRPTKLTLRSLPISYPPNKGG